MFCRPGQIRFEEKWLKDVIESKILMLRAIDFWSALITDNETQLIVDCFTYV